jgi:hypothetical protein
MKAKWLISTNDEGVNLTYHNLIDNVVFDCGTTKRSSNIQDFIDFALSEGAVDGDGVFVNNKLFCEIVLNGDCNERTRN